MGRDEAVMAVVHVKAPAELDPHVIEAELTRAICTYRKRPMSAELTLATEAGPPRRHGLRRHGFVALLSIRDVPDDLEARLQKVTRKALKRRFGADATARVTLGMTDALAGAFWCSVRGTPLRCV
ncbi:hypothetical protein ACQEVB_10675 [Pseudonocardia sp. CA-107938]|uniref:hypothetical protein n=1 Tax=Pseudonocardia sp. CA-107938 TaxID=3240021 RepID=UPI003D8A9ECB